LTRIIASGNKKPEKQSKKGNINIEGKNQFEELWHQMIMKKVARNKMMCALVNEY
jgi:hypothetical protein